ncbi:unnamed protein product [Absidia cylindrospora]
MVGLISASFSKSTPPVTAIPKVTCSDQLQLDPLHDTPATKLTTPSTAPSASHNKVYDNDNSHSTSTSFVTHFYSKTADTNNGPMCAVMETLKGLWGINKKPKISSPYNAAHVNHIRFDFDANKWRSNGCYPETMALLPVAQKHLLATFTRQLYAELEITWNVTKEQCGELSIIDEDRTDSPILTHHEATLHVQQACKVYDPRFAYQSWAKIGEGASGIVYRAQNNQGLQVAIKRIRLYHHPRHDLLLNEIMVAKSPKCHPNIVQHLESYLWHDCIWIVMDFMDGGSLTDIVTYRYLFENEIATVCREVLHGLNYLHSHRIIHRDIKSDNILISRQGHIKLSDFGFSARLDPLRLQRNTIAGTPCWMAPEIVANEPYGCKVDIWSFGITVIEMIESKPPYFSQPNRATAMLKLKQQPSLQHPERLGSTFRHFLYQCFELEPQRRSSAKELLQHSFMESVQPIETLLPVIHAFINPSVVQ